MKKILLLSFLFAIFSANAQWKTIYEGGFGTPISLHFDSGFRFYIDPVDTANQHYFTTSSNQNGIGLHADFFPAANQTVMAGITKYIPEMEHYTSLRIYLDLDLPDSVGTIYYHKFPDTIDFPATTSWPPFASDISSSWVQFSNFEGDNMLFLYSLFDLSPAVAFYRYLRVDADTTTQVLNVPTAVQADFNVFSSGKELHIQPSQPDADYEVQLVDLSGKCIYQEQKSGQQHIPLDCSKGIYLVRVTQNESQYQSKIYVE